MKKSFTKLLVISMICAILSFALCIFSIKTNNFNFSTTKEVVNDVNEMGSDNPGAGWYFLWAGGTAAMVDMAIGFAYLFLIILIPGFMLFIIIVSQCIARLVQIGEEKNWKNITSKVFTYISMTLQFLLVLVLIFDLVSNLSVNKILLVLALTLNISSIVLFIKELLKIKKVTAENI